MYGIPDLSWKNNQSLATRQADGSRRLCSPLQRQVGVDVNETQTACRERCSIIVTAARPSPRFAHPGRNLKGVYYAREFLTPTNPNVNRRHILEPTSIMAPDKDVIIIGGGDTGSDCTGPHPIVTRTLPSPSSNCWLTDTTVGHVPRRDPNGGAIRRGPRTMMLRTALAR